MTEQKDRKIEELDKQFTELKTLYGQEARNLYSDLAADLDGMYQIIKYQQARISELEDALHIANRCIDNGDLILKGSAYDSIIKDALPKQPTTGDSDD